MSIDKAALDLLLDPAAPEPARAIAQHGAAIRLDAARRMGEARAALAAAEADYDAGTAIIQHALHRGWKTQNAVGLQPGPRMLPPAERPLAVPHRYDPQREQQEQRLAGLLPKTA